MRVSQGWAGNGYGQFILPRVGREVLVSFINGNPDRAIITGCLFNGNNAVPYVLPEHKTRSTFKAASSPGAESSNELRFEDKAGSEEIYLHAAKDYQERISNNSHSHIVNDRQQLIEGQHTIEVRGEVHHTVLSTSHWHAKADEHHIINNNRHTLVASKELLTAGQEIHLSTGQKIVLEAGAELTFKAGGSYLKLDPSGVTMVGPTVDLNNGGSPSKGTPVMAKLVAKLLGSNANYGKGMRSAPNLAATLLPNMTEGNQALQGKFRPILSLTSTPTKDSQQVPESVGVCDKQVPQAAESGLGNCAFYYQPLHDKYLNKTEVATWEAVKAWARFWNPWNDQIIAKRLIQNATHLSP